MLRNVGYFELFVVVVVLAVVATCVADPPLRHTPAVEWAAPNPSLLMVTVGDDLGSCTAFAFETPGVWATAKHCAREGAHLTITGTPVTVLWEHPDTDAVLLRGPTAKPFHLGAPPDVLSKAHYMGWVKVNTHLARVSFFAFLSAKNYPMVDSDIWPAVNLWQTDGGPGVSGAALLDGRNQVVGMALGGTHNLPVMLVSAPWDVMAELSRVAKES